MLGKWPRLQARAWLNIHTPTSTKIVPSPTHTVNGSPSNTAPRSIVDSGPIIPAWAEAPGRNW